MIIRRVPEDFRVTERLDDSWAGKVHSQEPPAGAAAFALYRLEKVSLTTQEAVQQLARALGVKPGRVSYAGLKDKHAATVQHVSVARAAGWTSAAEVRGQGWSAERLGWATSSIAAADIKSNEFSIVVREIQAAERDRFRVRASLLGRPDDSGVIQIVNYFGDQRFGSARHGEGFAAVPLVRGDFETALRLLIATPARKDSGGRRLFTRLLAARWGDWTNVLKELPGIPERAAVEQLAKSGGDFQSAFAVLPNLVQVMAVEAFQSHLWNGTVRRMVLAASEADPACIVRADDEYGEMVFLRPSSVPADWNGVQIPMPAAEAPLDGPWRTAMLEAVAAEGLEMKQLRVPTLRRPVFGTALRPMLVEASGFEVDDPCPDELSKAKPRRYQQAVRFRLPRGAYATVVLRALGQ